MTSRGFIYVATGETFLSQAARSARQISELMPKYNIAIITDEQDIPNIFDNKIKLTNPEYGFGDKVGVLHRSPFDQTVYLDSDTYLRKDIPELFDILDRFDLCAVQDMGRNSFSEELDIPLAVPEYNTGVIAYRMNQRVSDFMLRWEEYYNNLPDEKFETDQPAFRKAIYKSNISIGTLPREYNVSTIVPGAITGQARVIHATGRNSAESVAKSLKTDWQKTDWRVYVPMLGEVKVFTPNESSIIRFLFFSLASEGNFSTIKNIYNYLRYMNKKRW